MNNQADIQLNVYLHMQLNRYIKKSSYKPKIKIQNLFPLFFVYKIFK